MVFFGIPAGFIIFIGCCGIIVAGSFKRTSRLLQFIADIWLAILCKIPRIVVIEETSELRLAQKHCLYLEAQQAEAILQNGQADLIAVGRQSQFNPNIALHWAHDLGINTRFEDWSPEYGWWLEKRIRTLEGFATPTGVVTRRS